MTNKDSRTIIYNYHDQTTSNIIIRWAEQYAEIHNCSIDYAMVVTLLEINKRGN